MLALFRAAVAHDLPSMERNGTIELKRRIAIWRADGECERVIAMLAKTDVLNDSTMIHIPRLLDLNICDHSLLDKKQNLVPLFIKLDERYPLETVRKAMARAAPLRDAQISALVRNVDDLVLQLTNRDNRKKKR